MQCLSVRMESGLREVCNSVVMLRGSIVIVIALASVGAADPATHKIYIWDISNDGQFASTLDGGREPLVHVHVSSLLLRSLPTRR